MRARSTIDYCQSVATISAVLFFWGILAAILKDVYDKNEKLSGYMLVAIPMILAGAGMIYYVLPPVIDGYHLFRTRHERRRYQNEMEAGKEREVFNQIENLFVSLAAEEKQAWVKEGLAEMDGVGNISLIRLYFCPIGRELLINPVTIKIRKNDGEIGEENHVYEQANIMLHMLTSKSGRTPFQNPIADKTPVPLNGAALQRYTTYIARLKQKLAENNAGLTKRLGHVSR